MSPVAGPPDYYETLQVHPAADPEVIQAAYRRLSMKYHPDVYHGPDAQQRMALLNAAYSVLSDATKRCAYDAQRGQAPRAAPARQAERVPTLQVTPPQLDLGTSGFGRTRTATVRVRNTGQGRMSGFAVSHVPWLRVTPAEFNSNDLDVTILFKPDRSGEFSSPRAVEVYSNGGRVTVAVRATVSPSEERTGQESTRPAREGAGSTRPSATPTGASAQRSSASSGPTGKPRGGIARRPAFELARPVKQRVRVPFSAWVVLGMVLSSVIWFQIAPVLTAVPMGLGVWLLWDRASRRRRLAAPPPMAGRPGPGHSTLSRCPVCNASVLSSAAAKCSRCGGSVCPSCNTCPCRTTPSARR